MADREQQLEVIRLADQIRTATNVSHARALATALQHLGVSLERTPAEIEADDAREEKAMVRDVDKQMRALGFTIVNYSQSRATKQTAGVQDHEYFHVDRRVFLKWEAKTPDGEQSPAQRDYQSWCDACRIPYLCGTDQDLFNWLIERRIARRDEFGYLVMLSPEGAR